MSKSHNQYEQLIAEAKKQGKQIPEELIDRESYSLNEGLGVDYGIDSKLIISLNLIASKLLIDFA